VVGFGLNARRGEAEAARRFLRGRRTRRNDWGFGEWPEFRSRPSSRVQNAKLIFSTPTGLSRHGQDLPRYKPQFELAALIEPDRQIKQLKSGPGHPLLPQAALDAVKNWVYEPSLLNSNPASVSITVDVIFTPSQ
jgi:hypothetical protein